MAGKDVTSILFIVAFFFLKRLLSKGWSSFYTRVYVSKLHQLLVLIPEPNNSQTHLPISTGTKIDANPGKVFNTDGWGPWVRRQRTKFKWCFPGKAEYKRKPE